MKNTAINLYAVNIGRFMRNNFSGEEAYGYIFQGCGGWTQKTAWRMLHPTNRHLIDNDMFVPVNSCLSNCYSAVNILNNIQWALENLGASG